MAETPRPSAVDPAFSLPKNFYLPKTTIYNIMKTSLPNWAKTAVPARECVQSCVTEFIMFITGEYVPLPLHWRATELIQRLKRKNGSF